MIKIENRPGDWNAQVRILLPEPVTFVVVSVHAVLFVDMLTNPLKPLRDATVNVELPRAPVFNVNVAGVAVILKSWKVKIAVALWERLPLFPIMVRV